MNKIEALIKIAQGTSWQTNAQGTWLPNASGAARTPMSAAYRRLMGNMQQWRKSEGDKNLERYSMLGNPPISSLRK